MKPLISEATLSAKKDSRPRDRGGLQPFEISTISIHILDISPGEFQSHFMTLWAHFQKAYARTTDSWSIRISSLGLHHRALDLALISLAAMRLSLCGEKRKYEVFSLSAYNESLQLFRKLLQNERRSDLLVVISLIFTLFEAAQQCPTKIYQSGCHGHLNGALSLLKRQGPSPFRTGGFHVAFKKLREMAVSMIKLHHLTFSLFTRINFRIHKILLAFSTQDASFFADPEWLNDPWTKTEKSSRDKLYDIAARMTVLHSKVHSEVTVDLIDQHWKIDHELVVWRSEWLQNDHPDLQIFCKCKEDLCLCIPHSSLSPSNEACYTGSEYLALLLMHANGTLRLYESLRGLHEFETITFFENQKLMSRVEWVSLYLNDLLSLPCFGRAMSDVLGITEGRCRSLLPVWALSQRFGISRDEPSEWWSKLNDRLNYGLW